MVDVPSTHCGFLRRTVEGGSASAVALRLVADERPWNSSCRRRRVLRPLRRGVARVLFGGTGLRPRGLRRPCGVGGCSMRGLYTYAMRRRTVAPWASPTRRVRRASFGWVWLEPSRSAGIAVRPAGTSPPGAMVPNRWSVRESGTRRLEATLRFRDRCPSVDGRGALYAPTTPPSLEGWKDEPEACLRARVMVTWLILPVVICLSQRLSHACLSINILYRETANGSLNQL